MKITIVSSLPSSLYNFRGEFIKCLIENNTVTAISSGVTKNEKYLIEKLGIEYDDVFLKRNGLNPIFDIITFLELVYLFNKKKPNIVFSYTIKPVIWTGFALYFRNVKYYAMITGLGYTFNIKQNLSGRIIRGGVITLYKLALKKAEKIIFQNKENMQIFIDEMIVPKEKCFLVNGSGVNLSHYNIAPLPSNAHFLLIARLLGDKGIREYVKAAEIVKQKYPDTVFELVGPEDPSPDGIKLDEINQWNEQGIIKYSGATTDVRPYIENCSIYVLPSYHEGMPRTVLEAMAMGRPILTTDVPGCRETVVTGENGWLVEKANVEQLAERMVWFIENQDQWGIMGQNSHKMANEKFDVHKVNAEIMKIMGLSDEKTL